VRTSYGGACTPQTTCSSNSSSPELGTGHAALPSALLVKLVGHIRHSEPPSAGPYVPVNRRACQSLQRVQQAALKTLFQSL